MTRSQIAQRIGLSPGYITMLKQNDRGQRIAFSAYAALPLSMAGDGPT